MIGFTKITKMEKSLIASVPLIALVLFISFRFKGISEIFLLLLGLLFVLFIVNNIISVLTICKCKDIRSIIPQIIVACTIITIVYIIVLLNSNIMLTLDFGIFYNKKLTIESSKIYAILNMIFLVYPLIIVLITLINKIVNGSKILLWVSTLIIAAFPALLFTAIMGQGDIFGLFFIVCILLLTYDYDFNNMDVKRLVYLLITTICLLITRRWYAFWIVSFYFSYIIYILASNIKSRKLLKCRVFNIIKFVGISLIIGTIYFSTMKYKMFGTSYSVYYNANNGNGFIYELNNQIGKLGIITVILILVGLVYGLYNKNLRKLTVIITFTGIINMVLFTRIQDTNNHQFLLSMPTYILLIVISLMCFYSVKSNIIKVATFSLICSFFATNFISSASVLNNKDLLFTNVSIRSIVRQDINEFLK